MYSSRRYNRVAGIAEYIIEGHTIKETGEEFRVSRETIRRELKFLAHCGSGEQVERNIELYKKAKIQLYRNKHQPTKKCCT